MFHGMIRNRICKEGTALSEQRLNRISVKIYGQTYNMVGTESPSHMRHVASTVDEQMHAIRNANPSLDIAKLAVLTAVNAVNDSMQYKARIEMLEAQLQKLKDDVND
jgi:cell division protein ZapA